MINVSTSKTLYCGALVATILVGCGKAKEKTVYVTQPQTTNPQTTSQTGQTQLPSDPAKQTDLLAVEIKNFSRINNQNLQQGTQIEFALKNSASQISGVEFKCAVERSGSTGTVVAQSCTSPYLLKTQGEGQYTFTVYAAHSSSPAVGNSSQVSFTVGSGYYNGTGGNPSGGYTGGGYGGGNYSGAAGGYGSQGIQVGDMLLVTVPSGMHTVYRSSTFDQPGYLKFRMIDASMHDSAAPYPMSCRQNQNFEQLVPDYSPAGRQLSYCEVTPPIAPNSAGDPFYNAFRWMNMNTMSYNSLAIASDGTLGAQGTPQQMNGPTLSRMYVNVFTNMSGQPVTQAQSMFTNEFSQTVSRLQISCGSQSIQYLGSAATFQGYFNWSVAVSPLFGCVNPRGGKWYVNVGTFPMDQITPMVPSCGWNCWAGQNFTNRRAAEIVAEIGPFDYPPAPMGLAPDAQRMMLQHIKRLTP